MAAFIAAFVPYVQPMPQTDLRLSYRLHKISDEVNALGCRSLRCLEPWDRRRDGAVPRNSGIYLHAPIWLSGRVRQLQTSGLLI